MRKQQRFTLSPSPNSCKEQRARLISVALGSALGLVVVSLLALVAHAATLSGPAEAPAEPSRPAELSREWQFEHKVVKFDDMFMGSREIEWPPER